MRGPHSETPDPFRKQTAFIRISYFYPAFLTCVFYISYVPTPRGPGAPPGFCARLRREPAAGASPSDTINFGFCIFL